jgi:hypothetical protein
MKRMLRFFALLISAGMVFSSCQKELSAETGNAKGTIVKDAGGNCMPATPNGTFKKDTTLTNNNYVDIQVNFTEVGIYLITSDTLNGYYFKASGVSAIAGVNTIRLLGTGKPLAVGTDVFTVNFDGSLCDFAVNVLDSTGGGGGGGTPVANFSFGSASGICTSTPNGIFAEALPTNATNYVDLAVTTISGGTYNLSTATINGVLFSGNGTLAAGATTLRLFANSTPAPVMQGPYSYTITSTGATTSSCNFSITYLAPIAPAAFTFNCPGATVFGTYQTGATMDPLVNMMVIMVNVSSAGSFNITTSANGITFAAAGVLAATPTQQIITLRATGVAGNTVGNVPFIIMGGGSPDCSKTVSFVAGGGGSTNYIKAKINGSTTFTTFDLNLAADTVNTGASSNFEISGDASSGEDILISIDKFGSFTASPTPFIITQFFSGISITVDYHTALPAFVLYNTTPINIVTADPFQLTITLITATRIEGTFKGSVEEDVPVGPTALTKKFTEGSFSLPL